MSKNSDRFAQFKELVNMFQNIESYVLVQWEDKRKAVTIEAVVQFCQLMGTTDLGYEVVGALLKQSEKIQVISDPVHRAVLIPRAIEAQGAIKEN